MSDALFLSAVVAVAGVMRGFSGFGFAMFAVPLATVVAEPARVVPVVLALQLASGLWSLRTDWFEIDRGSVVRLVVAALPFVFLGTWLLQSVPSRPVRFVVGGATLAAAAMLWMSRHASRAAPTPAFTIGTGAASGLLHGLVAMGGPPLTLYFLRGGFAPAVARASMTAIFSLISVGPLAAAIHDARFDAASGRLFVVLLPTMLIATWIGGRLFRRYPGRHRTVSIPMLATVGLFAALNAGLRG